MLQPPQKARHWAKRPYKSPNAACPAGWVRQAQTVISLIKRPVCPVGGCMGLNCSKQQDLKQCGGIGPAQKIQRQREP